MSQLARSLTTEAQTYLAVSDHYSETEDDRKNRADVFRRDLSRREIRAQVRRIRERDGN